MTNTANDYIPQLDWEGLHKSQTVDGPFDGTVIVPGVTRIEVSRDADYNIKGVAHGYTTQKNATAEEDESLRQRQDIVIQLHHATVSISKFLVQSITRTSPSSPGVNVGFDLVVPFTAQAVTINNTLNPDQMLYSFREWYINAPTYNHFLHQRVDRKKTVIYEHNRVGSFTVSDKFELEQYRQSGHQCIIIDAGNFRFLVECVPDSFAPAWSKKLMVEYRDEWGCVPDEMTRKCITDLLSLLFGRELIPIGTTSLNRGGYVINETLTSHARPNIRHLAKQNPHYSIDIKHDPAAFEKAFVTAMRAYQKRQEALPIAECLRRYWLAIELPMGLNIVILASALELLAKAWFKSNESTSHGTYMAHDAYRQLIQPEIVALEQKLKALNEGEAILKRILSAYNLGSNDHASMFFTEIGLPLNNEGRTILRGRNKYVHGGVIDIAKASQTWSGYEFLFSSAMQRILELL